MRAVDSFATDGVGADIEEAAIEIPEDESWAAESPAEPPVVNRAHGWAVIKDVARELASSLMDAYATFRRDGIIEAIRMLTSHFAQLFVGTSAFFIFNLGRRLHALWQRMHGGPAAG